MNTPRTEPLRLNLGCGPHLPEGYVNVDMVPLPGVDLIADVDEEWPWADETVDEILASHLFEHVRNPVLFMAEAHRVLVPDGLLDIRVPGGRFVADGYWLPHIHSFTDPTHLRHCTPITWDYWVPGEALHDGYGAGFGSEDKEGPRFRIEQRSLIGEQQEELRVMLRKLP